MLWSAIGVLVSIQGKMMFLEMSVNTTAVLMYKLYFAVY